MAVDDLWYLKKKGPNGTRIPSKRHGRGNRYRVTWVDGSGDELTRSFARKADAQAHDANVHADLSRGQYIDPKSGRLTFGAYAERWEANQVHREATQAQIEGVMRRHVLPQFGTLALASIRPTDIQAWVRRLANTLAPVTVELVYQYGKAVFQSAVNDRLIPFTPCVGVKLPRKQRKPVEPLPLELVSHLAAAIDLRYQALIWLGAASGLRQGEALGLEVGRVNFFRKTLRVDQQLVSLPGALPYLGPLKTAASYRTIPISDFLVDALAAHLKQHPVREVEVIDKTGPKPVTRVARLIFTDEKGDPISRALAGRRIRPAVVLARAALVKDAGGSPAAVAEATALSARFATASFHGLRHFYASLLISEGCNVKVVQECLGHANASETMDTYSHLWPDADDRTRQAVQLVLGGAAQARKGVTEAV